MEIRKEIEKLNNKVGVGQIEEAFKIFDGGSVHLQEDGSMSDVTPEIRTQVDEWSKEIEGQGKEPVAIIVTGMEWNEELSKKWQYVGKINGQSQWKPREQCNHSIN